MFVLGDGVLEAAENFWTQASERYEQRSHDVERPILPLAELYLPPQLLRERLNTALRIDVVAKATNEHAIDLGTQPAPLLPINRKGESFAEELKRFPPSSPARISRARADRVGLGRAARRVDRAAGACAFIA